MTATITIEAAGPSTYLVTVNQRGSVTRHTVTATPQDIAQYAPAGTSPERLIEASFAFLLEREPASAILSSFALPVIERYFPEYSSVIRTIL
ncbi:MAG TPA: hypothetical protein VFB92_16340 [Vicinamibacterales bacterium]|nr:hypothetical protein [Vicinamibacterales bacterium]